MLIIKNGLAWLHVSTEDSLSQIFKKGVEWNERTTHPDGSTTEIILCQSEPFFLSFDKQWFDVLFEKPLDKLYVDWGDYYIEDGTDLGGRIPEPKNKDVPVSELDFDPKQLIYGMYVFEVRPEEIRSITVRGDFNEGELSYSTTIYRREV